MSSLQTETGSGVQCCRLTPYHISSESPPINPHPLILLPGLGPRKLSSSPRLAHFVIIEINSSLGVSEWVGGVVGGGGSKMAPSLRAGPDEDIPIIPPAHTRTPCLSPILYGSSGVFINILNGFVRPTVRIGSLIGFPN